MTNSKRLKGRPFNVAPTLSVQKRFRLTQAENAELNRRAAASGLTLSRYIRLTLLGSVVV